MRRRSRRTVPALALSLALLAGCAAVVLSLVQRLTSARQLLSYASASARLRVMTWDDRWVLVAGAGAVVVGLVLVALAILPGRAILLPLTGDDQFAAGVGRRGLCGSLRAAAHSVEGVHSARIRLRRKNVRVTVRTGYAHSANLTETVRAAVDERIARIGPRSALRVSVEARTKPGLTSRRRSVAGEPRKAGAL
ncbi:DUF6286 domain-containing protein [Nocardia alni]|uniref:DUF6286 domain-containing protein n=1 Tax=Nocardia alni TaxID=2815723 RepID=UPI001C23B99D|nr:DUF6286 domain-containing protein [Nocardia alni]